MSFEPKRPQGEPLVTAFPIDAPQFYASAFYAMCGGNDAFVIANSFQPSKLETGEPAPFMPQEPVAILAMSIGSFKDLAVLLTRQVAEHERRTGRVIETEFTKQDANNGR